MQGERRRKDGVSTRLPASEAAPIRLFLEEEKLGPGWNHVVREPYIQGSGFSTKTPSSNGAGERTEVKASRKGNQNKNVTPKTTVVEPRPIHTDSAIPTLPIRSPVEGIADLLNNLPT
jgi:hypothetical protein